MQAKGNMMKPEKALEELANTNTTFNYPKKTNTCFRETTQFKSVYKNLYKTAHIYMQSDSQIKAMNYCIYSTMYVTPAQPTIMQK